MILIAIFIFAIVYIIVAIAIPSPRNLVSLLGLAMFIILFYVFSHNPARVSRPQTCKCNTCMYITDLSKVKQRAKVDGLTFIIFQYYLFLFLNVLSLLLLLLLVNFN